MSAADSLGLSTPLSYQPPPKASYWVLPAALAPPTSPSPGLETKPGPSHAPSRHLSYLPILHHHLPGPGPAGFSWTLLTAAHSPSLCPCWLSSLSRGPAGIPIPSRHPPSPVYFSLQRRMDAALHPRPCLPHLAVPVHLLAFPSSPDFEPPGPVKSVLMAHGEERKQLRGL